MSAHWSAAASPQRSPASLATPRNGSQRGKWVSHARNSAGPSLCSKNGYEARWRARRDIPGSMAMQFYRQLKANAGTPVTRVETEVRRLLSSAAMDSYPRAFEAWRLAEALY